MGVGHAGRLAESREFIDVAARQGVGRPRVEVPGPARFLRARAPVGEEGQAMGHVARADEQDPVIAQRLQAASELEQGLGVVGRQ